MNTMIRTMIVCMTFAQATAFGADKTKVKAAQMTPEQRQSMATSHEKMAVCLRSDRPFEDCKKEMMESCKDMMGKDGCPMMDHMGKMHGMDKGMKDKKD